MKHVMIDLETLGTDSNSVILSLAAVEFDLHTGATGKEFYKKINLESCLTKGLKINNNTIFWWMDQKKEVLQDLLDGVNEVSLHDALVELSYFLQSQEYCIWGNGPRFDLGILHHAFQKCQLKVPWKHYNERCVRTLSALHPEIKKELPFDGDRHNALADCYHQIKYCSKTYQHLFVSKELDVK